MFDNFNIVKTLVDDEYTSVYLVEDIKTKEKFLLKRLPADTSNPFYDTAAIEFKEMIKHSVRLSKKASSPAILDFLSEDGKSFLLLEYKGEKNLKDITSYFSIGKILNNRYLVIRGIAGGGFGMVYLARDTSLPGKYWAVKEMVREGGIPEVIERSFRIEAQMLSSIEHPSIPRISDFFVEENKLYLVMDYVKGETLKKMLRALPEGEFFPEDQVVKWALSMCDVLEYLHNRLNPIVFRDIKPDNIMITLEGELRLIDFGIARVFEGPRADTTKYALFTEGYAPPEQWAGKAEPRSDVYSLGVTLYHLLTKIHPRELAPHFPPVESINSSISPALSNIINKSIQLKLDTRYQSIEELKRDLLNLCEVKKAHEQTDIHIVKAKKYEEKGDFFNANFEYMKALEFDRENYEVLLGIAVCCEKLGFSDKAQEKYRQLLKLEIPAELRNDIEKKLSIYEQSHGVDEEDDEKTICPVDTPYELSSDHYLPEASSKPAVLPPTVPYQSEQATASSSAFTPPTVPYQSEQAPSSVLPPTVPYQSEQAPSSVLPPTVPYQSAQPPVSPSTGQEEEIKGHTVPVKIASPDKKVLKPLHIVIFLIVGVIAVSVFIAIGLVVFNYNTIVKYFVTPLPTQVAYKSPVPSPEVKITPSVTFSPSPAADDIKDKISLARNYYNKGIYTDAVIPLKKVLAKEPDNIEARLLLGDIYRKEENLVSAMEEYNRVLRKEPDNQLAHLGLGHIYRIQKNVEKAIEEYKKADDQPASHNDLGIIYVSQGNIDEAIKEFEKSAEIDPEDARTYVNLGSAYYAKKDWTNAIDSYNKAIEKRPKNAEAYYGLGMAYKKNGDREKALNSFKEFIKFAHGDHKIQEAEKEIESLK